MLLRLPISFQHRQFAILLERIIGQYLLLHNLRQCLIPISFRMITIFLSRHIFDHIDFLFQKLHINVVMRQIYCISAAEHLLGYSIGGSFLAGNFAVELTLNSPVRVTRIEGAS